MTMQRYRLGFGFQGLNSDPEGEYVHFTDAQAAIEAERTARLAAEEQWFAEVVDWELCFHHQCERAEAAEAALAALQAPAALKIHASDCSRHNAPAYEAGVCDCGAALEDTP